MPEIRTSRERLNGYRMERHSLWPRRVDLAEVLSNLGWLPTREAALLALAARIPDFAPADFGRLVFEEGGWVEMAALTDQSVFLPRSIAAAALRCPAPRRREAADEALDRARITTPQRLSLRLAVLDALLEKPLAPPELRLYLGVDEGEAGDLVDRTGVLSSILALLQVDGAVVRTSLPGDILAGRVVYDLAARFLPDEEVTALSPAEALQALCAFYFQVCGPATVSDFCFWCGAGRAEAEAAFQGVAGGLVPVHCEELPF